MENPIKIHHEHENHNMKEYESIDLCSGYLYVCWGKLIQLMGKSNMKKSTAYYINIPSIPMDGRCVILGSLTFNNFPMAHVHLSVNILFDP